MYYSRWQDVLDQINYENSLKGSGGGDDTKDDTTPYTAPYKLWGNNTYASNIDIDSLAAAVGTGPISSSEAAALERQGVIESYVENGVIKYRKKSAKPATSGATMVYR